MCRLFQATDKGSYSVLTRKLRIHGHSTSVRLERGFWAIIEDMARFEGKSVGRLVTSLHDEIRRTETDLTNFASCLRVIALHYVIGGTREFDAESATTLVTGNSHGH
ncbi:ribbon-helix-helix domain-containing protein [Tardiphaga sp.]|uniref:ribbon-helix-helix domain-containing protein n=1 Tax=Tardiphaga sp. TaxID=1926292 RepID=UPI00352B44CC